MSASYRPDVDGLRAVAVLAVLAFHAFPSLAPGGFTGVDVFFVISGYLISGIILDDIERRRFSVAYFYWRRIRRIFPALVLVLAACLAIGCPMFGVNQAECCSGDANGCLPTSMIAGRAPGASNVSSSMTDTSGPKNAMQGATFVRKP